MIGHRCSALPIAQFCGLAPVLGAKHGSGRSAAMSSAFHAKAARDEGWEAKWARLTDEEQKTVDGWKEPERMFFGKDGDVDVLQYEDAYKEERLGLNAEGAWVEYDDPTALTAGTADMFWVVGDTLYLADMKRSRFTESDPMNLQNLAYGFAAASKHQCTKLRLGLWYPEDGKWGPWSDAINLVSEQAVKLLQRVLAAAANDDKQASIGDHCNGCWDRKHCPEWMLPPAVLEKEFIDTVEEGLETFGGQLMPDQALKLRRLYERGKDFLEALEPIIKAYAREHGGIRDEKAGKVWTEIQKKGTKRIQLKLIKERYPEVAKECTARGAPTKSFVWKKI